MKVRAQDKNVIPQCAKAQIIYCVFHCTGTAPKLQSLLSNSGHEKSNRSGLEIKSNLYVQKEEKEENETVQHHHLMQPWFHTDIFSSLQYFACVKNTNTGAFQLPLLNLRIV